MKLYQNPCTDPHFNLALEEYLLTQEKQDNFILLWRNRPSVILGLNQNALEEIREEEAALRGIPVVRRSTGGGAVYHDLGNLNFSFITDFSPGKFVSMQEFLTPVLAYLHSLGLPAIMDGRNDIVIAGHKVSGNAQRITGGRILHHGTLLFQSDLSVLARVLKPYDAKFQSKSTKSVRTRVANICQLLPAPMTLEEFQDGLLQYLTQNQWEPWEPSPMAKAHICQLSKEKYESCLWNYGNVHPCTFQNRKHFPGGTLEVRLIIKEDRMENIAIYGDFLATEEITPLLQRLKGVPYNKKQVYKTIHDLEIQRYLGGISLEEFLMVCFPNDLTKAERRSV